MSKGGGPISYLPGIVKTLTVRIEVLGHDGISGRDELARDIAVARARDD